MNPLDHNVVGLAMLHRQFEKELAHLELVFPLLGGAPRSHSHTDVASPPLGRIYSHAKADNELTTGKDDPFSDVLAQSPHPALLPPRNRQAR